METYEIINQIYAIAWMLVVLAIPAAIIIVLFKILNRLARGPKRKRRTYVRK